MSDKGPQRERRPESAADRSRDDARNREAGVAHAAGHESATGTRGASPGSGASRRAGAREEERARDDGLSAQATEFARQLADLTAAQGAGDGDMELGVDDLEVDGLEVERLQGPVGSNAAAMKSGDAGSARGNRALKQFGDESDPPGEADTGRPAVRAAAATSAPTPRIRAEKRADHVELEALLALGVELGLLGEYQSSCVAPTLLRLNWQEFEQLQAALDLCEGSVERIIVLKALAAHRATASLLHLAESLANRGEQALTTSATATSTAEARSGDLTTDELRLHYDPIAALTDDDRVRVTDVPNGEHWKVPLWLRGVPIAALEMAIVAVDQCLCGDLHPEQRPGQGADDLLTKALEHHGRQHPSLERWLLALCARADSRDGLLLARDVLLRARNQLV